MAISDTPLHIKKGFCQLMRNATLPPMHGGSPPAQPLLIHAVRAIALPISKAPAIACQVQGFAVSQYLLTEPARVSSVNAILLDTTGWVPPDKMGHETSEEMGHMGTGDHCNVRLRVIPTRSPWHWARRELSCVAP